jgi:hypothetical protein
MPQSDTFEYFFVFAVTVDQTVPGIEIGKTAIEPFERL